MIQIDSVLCVTGGMLSRQMEIDARSLKLDKVEFQKVCVTGARRTRGNMFLDEVTNIGKAQAI